MLEISINASELWDEVNEEFVILEPCKLILEHSLISLSKWEAKWNKPFLVEKPPKTKEEMIDYIRCMTVGKPVDPRIYLGLTDKDVLEIDKYINSPMTATTFTNHSEGRPKRSSKKIMTSEVIYYCMISFGIPFECEKWHLNRLMTLIKVCEIENSPKQKMSKSAAAKQQRALNAQRRAKARSRG